MSTPDFEFSFGKERYLRGWGWRGLVALAFFLAALVAVAWLSPPMVSKIAGGVGHLLGRRS